MRFKFIKTCIIPSYAAYNPLYRQFSRQTHRTLYEVHEMLLPNLQYCQPVVMEKFSKNSLSSMILTMLLLMLVPFRNFALLSTELLTQSLWELEERRKRFHLITKVTKSQVDFLKLIKICFKNKKLLIRRPTPAFKGNKKF